MTNHTRPATKTVFPPKISAKRPKGRRKAPVTKETTLAGHVCASEGISRAMDRDGSRTLNPEIKYSATNMDPNSEKQKPTSTHADLNAAGRSLPNLSISDDEYAPPAPSSSIGSVRVDIDLCNSMMPPFSSSCGSFSWLIGRRETSPGVLAAASARLLHQNVVGYGFA